MGCGLLVDLYCFYKLYINRNTILHFLSNLLVPAYTGELSTVDEKQSIDEFVSNLKFYSSDLITRTVKFLSLTKVFYCLIVCIEF